MLKYLVNVSGPRAKINWQKKSGSENFLHEGKCFDAVMTVTYLIAPLVNICDSTTAELIKIIGDALVRL